MLMDLCIINICDLHLIIIIIDWNLEKVQAVLYYFHIKGLTSISIIFAFGINIAYKVNNFTSTFPVLSKSLITASVISCKLCLLFLLYKWVKTVKYITSEVFVH